MQLKYYNSDTGDSITIKFSITREQNFFASYFALDGKDTDIILSQTIGGTETELWRYGMYIGVYSLPILRITGNILEVYINGAKLWQGEITPIIINCLSIFNDENFDYFLDELHCFTGPQGAGTEDQIKTWYKLKAPFYDPNPIMIAPRPTSVSGQIL